MTRTEIALSLAGGAIGGAAAIGGMWLGRHWAQQDITAAPYDQAATITDTLGKLRARRKAAHA